MPPPLNNIVEFSWWEYRGTASGVHGSDTDSGAYCCDLSVSAGKGQRVQLASADPPASTVVRGRPVLWTCSVCLQGDAITGNRMFDDIQLVQTARPEAQCIPGRCLDGSDGR